VRFDVAALSPGAIRSALSSLENPFIASLQIV
jgi:hypothetical protein